MDGQTDWHTDRLTYRQTDIQTHTHTHTHTHTQRDGWMDGQTDWHTDTHTHTQRDVRTDGQTDRQTDRHTHTHRGMAERMVRQTDRQTAKHLVSTNQSILKRKWKKLEKMFHPIIFLFRSYTIKLYTAVISTHHDSQILHMAGSDKRTSLLFHHKNFFFTFEWAQ
jgi:hypothetical protein